MPLKFIFWEGVTKVEAKPGDLLIRSINLSVGEEIFDFDYDLLPLKISGAYFFEGVN